MSLLGATKGCLTLTTRRATLCESRVERSALVRIDQVKELQPNQQGDYTIVLRNGTRVPLSRTLRGRFEKFLAEG